MVKYNEQVERYIRNVCQEGVEIVTDHFLANGIRMPAAEKEQFIKKLEALFLSNFNLERDKDMDKE